MIQKGFTPSRRPYTAALIVATMIVGPLIALAGCSGDSSDRRGGGGPRTAGASLIISAALPGGKAKGAYIDQNIRVVEARVYPFSHGSWDAFWNAAISWDSDFDFDDCYDDECGSDQMDSVWSQLYLWEWEGSARAGEVVLTGDQSSGRIDLAPGNYLVVAAAWDNTVQEGDPLAISSAVMDLEAGEQTVALNLLTATWDIKGGGPIELGLLNQTFLENGASGDPFDWNPSNTWQTNTPAEALGLTGGLAGLHIGRFFGGPDWLGPFLGQHVLFRTLDGDGEIWLEPGGEILDGPEPVEYYVDTYVDSEGAFFQDYGRQRGNRAEMYFPLVAVDAWTGWDEAEGSRWREAGVFIAGRPFMMPEPDDPATGEYEWSSQFTAWVCIANADPECMEREVVYLDGWGWEDTFEPETDWEALARGTVRDGVEIDVTFIEWQDTAWTATTSAPWEVPELQGASATSTGVAGTLSERKRKAIVQGIQRERQAVALGLKSAEVIIEEGDCYDIDTTNYYYEVDYVWDGGQWLSGTLLWFDDDEWGTECGGLTGDYCFVAGKYRDPITWELVEEFRGETTTGATRICAHDATLVARQLDIDLDLWGSSVAATATGDFQIKGAIQNGDASLTWTTGASKDAVFNLCRAREEISTAGFANCAALDGGVLETGVSSPFRFPTGGARHWVQLEAENDARSAYSPVAAVMRRGVYPVTE